MWHKKRRHNGHPRDGMTSPSVHMIGRDRLELRRAEMCPRIPLCRAHTILLFLRTTSNEPESTLTMPNAATLKQQSTINQPLRTYDPTEFLWAMPTEDDTWPMPGSEGEEGVEEGLRICLLLILVLMSVNRGDASNPSTRHQVSR